MLIEYAFKILTIVNRNIILFIFVFHNYVKQKKKMENNILWLTYDHVHKLFGRFLPVQQVFIPILNLGAWKFCVTLIRPFSISKKEIFSIFQEFVADHEKMHYIEKMSATHN